MQMKFSLVRICKSSFERQVGETIRIKLRFNKGLIF